MKYIVKCPYCRENHVTVQHVMEGVWAISSEPIKYEDCAMFLFSLGSFLDGHQDDEIIPLLETGGEYVEQVRTTEQDLSVRPSESMA